MNIKNKKLSVIILGAGKGTRMKSDLSKVLHKVVGLPMIKHVINTAKTLNAKEIIAVVSKNNLEQIKETIKDNSIKFVVQKDLNGTGGAVKTGLKKIDTKNSNLTLIMYGDVPLIKQETYQKMIDKIKQKNSQIVVLGFNVSDIKNKYGRLIVSNNNILEKIIEYKDANETERNIRLCNSGILVVKTDILPKLLNQVKNHNASKEYYLTDIIGIAGKENLKCEYIIANEDEVMGVNSKEHLAKAEEVLQNSLRKNFMLNGVELIDPKTVYFSCDTEIGRNVVIYPNVFFGENVKIGDNVIIKPFCHLENCVIEKNVEIGPFARIRPETRLKENCKIGNFVEIKKSVIGKGTKIGHLSYIGDCKIGDKVNIGALSASCNYDGYKKYETKIGDNAFIGSNTIMVAPVKIERKAITGAGSVITKNVKENDIALGRADQINLKGKAKSYRKKRERK